MRRVDAFTLAEMIVALLLTIMVLSISYSAYFIVSKTVRYAIISADECGDVLFVNDAINNMVKKSQQIDKIDSTVYFSSEIHNDQMSYSNNSIVIKKGSITDSVVLPSSIKIAYLGDKLLNKRFVSAINLTVQAGDTSIGFIYRKDYAADFFINNQKH